MGQRYTDEGKGTTFTIMLPQHSDGTERNKLNKEISDELPPNSLLHRGVPTGNHTGLSLRAGINACNSDMSVGVDDNWLQYDQNGCQSNNRDFSQGNARL